MTTPISANFVYILCPYKTVQDKTKTPEGSAKKCGKLPIVQRGQRVTLWKNLWNGENAGRIGK